MAIPLYLKSYRMRLLISVVLSCFIYTSQAQYSSRLDSLWQHFHDESLSDRNRFSAIASITMSYLQSNPDSAEYFADLLCDLAIDKGNKRLLTYGNNYKGISYANRLRYQDAIDVYSKNLIICEENGDKEMLAGTHNNISKMYSKLRHDDKAAKHAKLGIKMAQEIGDTEYEMIGHLGVGHAMYRQSKYQESISAFSRAVPLAEKLNNTYEIAGAHMMIGNCLYSLGKLEKSIDHFNTSVLLYEEVNHSKNIAGNLVNIGRNYRALGEFDLAIDYFNRAILLLEEMNNKDFLASALINQASIYRDIGEFPKAIENLMRSKELKNQLGEQHGIIENLQNIALLYSDNGDLDEALDFAEQAFQLSQSTKSKSAEANSLDILAAINRKKGVIENALDLSNQAKLIHLEISGEENLGNYYVNVGSILFQKQDSVKAKEHLKKGIELARNRSQQRILSYGLLELGRLELANGNVKTAIRHLEEALSLAKNSAQIKSIRDISNALYYCYKKQGRSNKALMAHEQYLLMRDSLSSRVNQKAVIAQQIQFQYEKQKAIDDAEAASQILIEKEKIKNQKRLSLAIGFGFLASLILAWLAYNRMKVTQKQKTIIEKQKKQAEQSEKYKERFLANMSHEIRTPMNAIKGMTAILNRNDHLSDQAPYLRAMQKSSDNLLVILNDILDLSKIEAGKLTIQSTPFKLKSTIQHAYDLLKPKAIEKGLFYNFNFDTDLPENIIGDPQRLIQILVNLLSNAIKFTNDGGVELNVSKANENLQVTVTDTGVGIEKSNLDRLFKSFVQLGNPDQKQGGTGLGLSISRQLAELMNGQIWAESDLEKGSRFFLELPLLATSELPVNNKMTDADILSLGKKLSGINLLLVEDDPFNIMVVSNDLQYYIPNLDLTIAKNGKIALDKLNDKYFDGILMDVDMPELNGYETSKLIRQGEQESNIDKPMPIIAMTASLLNSEIQACYSSGMNDYIPKPYEMEQLLQALNRSIPIRQ